MAEDNKLLKLVYAFFVGVLLAIFVGVGIDTFYPGPTEPEYPIVSNYNEQPSKADIAKQVAFEKAQRSYQRKYEQYNRNVSIAALVASVVLLSTSLYLEKRRIQIIADGVMLGGLFTLIYSLFRGFAAQDSKYVFIVVTVGLVIVLYLGYHRFVEKTVKKGKK